MDNMGNELTTDEFAKICKALSHPTRVKILHHLKQINKCLCGEIVDMFPLSQSTISQHLKHLKDSGIIKGQVNGPRTCYCIDRDILEKYKNSVSSL